MIPTEKIGCIRSVMACFLTDFCVWNIATKNVTIYEDHGGINWVSLHASCIQSGTSVSRKVTINLILVRFCHWNHFCGRIDCHTFVKTDSRSHDTDSGEDNGPKDLYPYWDVHSLHPVHFYYGIIIILCGILWTRFCPNSRVIFILLSRIINPRQVLYRYRS